MKLEQRIEHVHLNRDIGVLRLLHISDIHLWFSSRVLKQLEGIINENCPDVVAMTGDYFDTPYGARLFRAFLQKICQKHLILMVTGNHDKIFGQSVANFHRGIPNCISVDDDVFCLDTDSAHRFQFASWKNRFRLSTALDEINIVLMHNPEKITTTQLSNIDLILAGHLHGGQVRLFKGKNNSHFPANLLYKHCVDRKQIGNTALIVSRGIGDTLPVRWNCPREVVRIEILGDRNGIVRSTDPSKCQ